MRQSLSLHTFLRDTVSARCVKAEGVKCTVKPVFKTIWEIGTTWELRTATSIPRSILNHYTEMDLKNKTTPEFKTVCGSPLSVPTSEIPLYLQKLCYPAMVKWDFFKSSYMNTLWYTCTALLMFQIKTFEVKENMFNLRIWKVLTSLIHPIIASLKRIIPFTFFISIIFFPISAQYLIYKVTSFLQVISDFSLDLSLRKL